MMRGPRGRTELMENSILLTDGEAAAAKLPGTA